jgi:predicted enzyme related to lactoylglutathione lyase
VGIIGLDHVQVASPIGGEPDALQGRGGVWFACGAQQLHVGVVDDFAPATKAHPALRVHKEDLDPIAERLLAAGGTVHWDDAIPDLRRFYTVDPWGNRIELLAGA